MGNPQNKPISKFSVNFDEVVFVSYTQLTAYYFIDHYVGISAQQQYGLYNITKQICQKYFEHKHYVPILILKVSTFLDFLGEKLNMKKLWIMKWTFKPIL